MFLEKVVRLVTVLATGVFVTRYLGAEQLGELNYAAAFVGLFLALTSMGLDEILVRDLVRHPERRDELLGSGAVLKLGGAVLLVVLATVIAWLKGMPSSTAAMVVIIALAELLKPCVIIEYWFTSQVQASRTSRVLIFQAFIANGFKLLLVALNAPLYLFAWTYLVEMVILTIGFTWLYHRSGSSVRDWRYSRGTIRYLIQQSWPLLIFGFALLIQARIDQVMLGDLLGRSMGRAAANVEVGQYSLALKMVESLGFLPVVVQRSLAPAITRAHVTDKTLYHDRMLNLYRLMFLMFLGTAIPLYILAEPLMVFLYGAEFQWAGTLLGLFALRLFFTNMGVAKTSFITNEGLFRYSLVTAVLGATVNISLNAFLIPRHGALGAVAASVISFTMSIFVVDLFFSRARSNFRSMVMGILTFWRLHRFN
ncbi:MAG: flippase [Flavobacteriales bacterium]|nr:flippase [Flavobacteriales bacterium]